MYKIIENEDSLLKWETETKNTLKLWENVSARNRINEMVQELDNCYGADRDIKSDLGGYTVILYGERKQTREDFKRILKHHSLQEDLYEFEEEYTGNQEKVTIRLYLCSNDYAVVFALEEND